MKLRIRGNTLRLRLTQTEVQTLRMRGDVGDRISFSANSHLDYVLQSDDAEGQGRAVFAAGTIDVIMPGPEVERWADTDQVAMRAEQDIGAGEVLSILVEKDFACLQPREGEDEADMFENPAARDGASC